MNERYVLVVDANGQRLSPTTYKTAMKLIKQGKATVQNKYPMKIILNHVVANPNEDHLYPILCPHGFIYVMDGKKRKKIMPIASERLLSPFDNRFISTIAYLHKRSSAIKALPPSENYRHELEALERATVRIKCDQWEIEDDKVDGISCLRIILVNAFIVNAMPNMIKKPIRIDHLWVVIDKEWKDRVKMSPKDILLVSGKVGYYTKNGKKNLGVFVHYIRPLQPNGEKIWRS